jgi:pimeloyl-ACP methyl ester carboxylesterase
MLSFSQRPSFFWLMTEPGRAITELGISYSYNHFFKNTQQGDGHPVMVIPGFMSTKHSTKVLRNYMGELGYDVYDWGMGRNTGKVEHIFYLLESIDEIYKKTGKQITVIGWSLGGIYARQLAKEKPELVRQVITMGSPFKNLTRPNNVEWIYSLISGGKKAKDTNHALLSNFPLPAPVPTTAIYSKEDGIVHWDTCMEDEDEIHQNIQVRGSHCGLGVNPSVLSVIADRLQYDKNNWRYFKPKGLVDSLLFYPSL